MNELQDSTMVRGPFFRYRATVFSRVAIIHVARNFFSKIPAAFTLIELLVVIVIFGVLASLLYPALKKSMNTAKAAACISNLHQMGGLFALYVSDQGKYPDAQQSIDESDGLGYMWFETLFRQTFSNPPRNARLLPWKLLTCPSEKFLSSALTSGSSYYYRYPVFISYAYNTDITSGLSSFNYPEHGTLSPALIGGNTVLLAEGYGAYPASTNWRQWAIDNLKQSVGTSGVHSDGMNVLYSDGHVAWRNTPLTIADLHPWGR